jgi:hypothetical protein
VTSEYSRRQPERKRRGRADRTARARLLLKAQLGWIGGYPIAVEQGGVAWRVAEPGPRVIDRAAIAGATRAFKRLCGEHRRALPALVGDVEAWAHGVEVALEALKTLIHRGGELGDLLAAHPAAARGRRLAGALPMLAPLVAALSWVDLAAPDRFAGDLRILERYGEAFSRLSALAERDPIATCLRLVELARGEEARVAGLMALLADPDLASTPTSLGDYAQRIAGRLDGGGAALGARPAATIAPAVLALVDWLAAAAPAPRRAALRAIAVADVPRYLGRWRMIWAALEPAEALAARSREAQERAPRDHAKRCRKSLLWIPPAAPSPLTGAALRAAIVRLSAPDARPLVALVAGSADDDDMPVRIELLVGLAAELEHLDRAGVTGLRALFTAYLDAAPDRARAWRALVPLLVAPRFRAAIALADRLPPARWRELGLAMAELVAGGREELDVDAILRLAVLVAATGRPDLAVRHLPVLESHAVSAWSDGIRAALALAEDPDAFARLLERMTEGDGVLAAAVDRVLGATGPAGAPLVRALIADQETSRLREAAAWIELARAIRGCALSPLPLPAAGLEPPWAERYPASLRRALALADAAGARAAAERKLEPLFPDRDRLRREIAAIDQRLSGGPPHLVRRRANLVAWLEAPRPMTPERLRRLALEIERSARAAVLDRWIAAIERAVLAGFPRAFGVPAAPAWLASREHRAALVAAMRLQDDSKRLVRRLIAARAGEPPWDLRAEPANRAFLARIARKRVKIAPWLDGIGSIRFEDPSGALELSLEPDPLEVLRMGEHFGTCLSPGGENFYSAVVNAVDINKRVIYARDASGAVVGRCLLALTDAGRILTFHPYHHRGDFENMVRGFAGELARRMGTQVVAHGTVTPLVASRWYDDGPRDLTGRHEFLAEDSTFRDQLDAIAPDTLVGALEAQLGSLDGASLSLVVALPELDSRPELVVPLLPLLDRAPDVALEIRLRAVQLAERAGARDRIGPRTAEHLAAGLAERLAGGRVALEPIDRLAALAPERLLMVVRGARRRLRPSERDRKPLLSYAAGVAHRALGRPRRAAEELERALATTSDNNTREVCRAALREVNRPAR